MAVENVALTSITVSGITVAALQWMKRSKYFPWITKEKVVLMRILSGFVAAAAAVGISYQWNAADHTLTIAGLTLGGVASLGWAWVKQFTMNEIVWQTTKPSSSPAVVEAVAPVAAAKAGLVPEKH